MDMDYDSTSVSDDPRDELIRQLTEEMNAVKSNLAEIRGQIEQQQTMVSREQQHYTDLAAELKTIEHNLDTVPRTDIRDKYNEALVTNQRLLTMRGQLEKFQSNHDYLERQQQLLAQIISKLQGVEFVPESDEDDGPARAGGANIIRIVQAQEDERQRLARQMHDGPAQSLTNFILQTEICQRLFDKDPARAAEELGNLKTAAGITFQKVREFIFDLRPMMLDDLGLVPTVRRYVDSFREKNDIEIELDITGEERRLENHREVLLFRGLQDVMGHARDYATPTTLNIRLDMGAANITIVVKDNGRGFDTSVLDEESEDPEIHEGEMDPRAGSLLTLKEKYELVGGRVQAVSTEGEGSDVRLELPSGE